MMGWLRLAGVGLGVVALSLVVYVFICWLGRKLEGWYDG